MAIFSVDFCRGHYGEPLCQGDYSILSYCGYSVWWTLVEGIIGNIRVWEKIILF